MYLEVILDCFFDTFLSLNSERFVVHKNLLIALLLAQSTLIAAMNASGDAVGLVIQTNYFPRIPYPSHITYDIIYYLCSIPFISIDGMQNQQHSPSLVFFGYVCLDACRSDTLISCYSSCIQSQKQANDILYFRMGYVIYGIQILA